MRWLTLILLLITAPALARSWEQITPFGKQPANAQETKRGFDLTAEDGVSFWVTELADDDRARGRLAWRWRLKDCDTPATALNIKGGDDRPLAIHVWFPKKEGEEMFGGLFGTPRPGYALTYVIGGTHAAGTVLQNPYLERGRLKIIAPMPTRSTVLQEVEVDVWADFREIFGMEPPVPQTHLAVSIDTDDTNSRCAVQVWFPEFQQ